MGKRATVVRMKQPDPVPFTKVGYENLKTRQTELLAKREIVLVSLQRAREMGDLSENGAYTAARFELGNVDRELRRLEFNLKYGVVTPVNGTDKVGFGNLVTVEINGKEYRYTLVGTQESDPKKAMLSLESPIGMALLGKGVGEKALVVMPDRQIEYIVKKIE
ncbi:MAG: GreA/GreB family elongation factor [bacterium]